MGIFTDNLLASRPSLERFRSLLLSVETEVERAPDNGGGAWRVRLWDEQLDVGKQTTSRISWEEQEVVLYVAAMQDDPVDGFLVADLLHEMGHLQQGRRPDQAERAEWRDGWEVLNGVLADLVVEFNRLESLDPVYYHLNREVGAWKYGLAWAEERYPDLGCEFKAMFWSCARERLRSSFQVLAEAEERIRRERADVDQVAAIVEAAEKVEEDDD